MTLLMSQAVEAPTPVPDEASSFEGAFPFLPFSNHDVRNGQMRSTLVAPYGNGSRHISTLPGGLHIMFSNFAFNSETSGDGMGRDLLKFHYKISGRNTVKFAGRPDAQIGGGRSLIAYHPEGLHKSDCFAADVREVSLTVACHRDAILNLLCVSSDELPTPIRRYSDCSDSDFLSNELPLTGRMRQALAELEQPVFSPALWRLHVQAKVCDLICLSLNELIANDCSEPHTTALKPRDVEMLHAVRELLEVHFSENLTVAALCQKFATNRSKLSEGFRILFGETIFEHIHKLRMEHAKLLLIETDDPISVIAEKIGYSCQSSLSTAFRQHHGTGPLKFRRASSAARHIG